MTKTIHYNFKFWNKTSFDSAFQAIKDYTKNNYITVNGSQLAKMKKSVPDMSLP